MISHSLISAFLKACHSEQLSRARRQYRAGQLISDNPNGVRSVGLVMSGRVDVYSVTLDGHDVHLNTLCKGECFGISNLLVGEELKTVLRCAEAAEILYLPKHALLQAMRKDPKLSLVYAEHCNRKLQFLIERIELLTLQSSRNKMIAYLLTQQDENGNIHLRGSREDLARKLGISRSALFRELALLQRRGAVRTNSDHTLNIPDNALLETLMASTAQRESV